MGSQEEELIEGAIKIYHDMKKNFDSRYVGRQLSNLLVNFEKSSLSEMLTDFDFRTAFIDLTLQISGTTLRHEVRNLSEEEISQELRSRIFTKKKYEYYAPINRLHGFPTSMTLGFASVSNFQDLPVEIRNHFLSWWKKKFSFNKEWFETEEQCVKVKERSIFIHFSVEAKGNEKANEKAKMIAEDALNIVRFLYEDKFHLMDMFYNIRETNEIGVGGGGFGETKIVEIDYSNEDEEKALLLNDIFTKAKPNEIENKLRNALRIYGIQTELDNLQVRFVTLVTCLECLLMTGGDKDYLAWKLAEKTAFIVGYNPREIYKIVKQAYKKRSKFVHGDPNEQELITWADIISLERIVSVVMWKLMKVFLKEGFTVIDAPEGKKSINEYTDDQKFGKFISKS